MHDGILDPVTGQPNRGPAIMPNLHISYRETVQMGKLKASQLAICP